MRRKPLPGWSALPRHVGLPIAASLGLVSGWPDNPMRMSLGESAGPRAGSSSRFADYARCSIEQYAGID